MEVHHSVFPSTDSNLPVWKDIIYRWRCYLLQEATKSYNIKTLNCFQRMNIVQGKKKRLIFCPVRFSNSKFFFFTFIDFGSIFSEWYLLMFVPLWTRMFFLVSYRKLKLLLWSNLNDVILVLIIITGLSSINCCGYHLGFLLVIISWILICWH